MRGRRQNPGFRHAHFWCHSPFWEISFVFQPTFGAIFLFYRFFLLLFQPTFGAMSFILSPFWCHSPFLEIPFVFQPNFGAIFLFWRFFFFFSPPLVPFFSFLAHFGAIFFFWRVFLLLFQPTFGAISFILSPFRCHFPFPFSFIFSIHLNFPTQLFPSWTSFYFLSCLIYLVPFSLS